MRRFFGVVFILLALAAGGCSLAFSIDLGGNSGDLALFWAVGGIPALLFGFIGWKLLSERP